MRLPLNGTARGRLGQLGIESDTIMHVRTQSDHQRDGYPYGSNFIDYKGVGIRHGEMVDYVVCVSCRLRSFE